LRQNQCRTKGHETGPMIGCRAGGDGQIRDMWIGKTRIRNGGMSIAPVENEQHGNAWMWIGFFVQWFPSTEKGQPRPELDWRVLKARGTGASFQGHAPLAASHFPASHLSLPLTPHSPNLDRMCCSIRRCPASFDGSATTSLLLRGSTASHRCRPVVAQRIAVLTACRPKASHPALTCGWRGG
jgi:hypothetical protein